MKDIVFNESRNIIIAIGQGENVTILKLDLFMINNNIRNLLKTRRINLMMTSSRAALAH